MNLVFITSIPGSNLEVKLKSNFNLRSTLFENRRSIKSFLPFFFKRLKKKPINTILEILLHGYFFLFSKTTPKDQTLIYDYETTNLHSQSTLEYLKSLNPDIIILGSTSIIKKSLIEIPTIGTINIHLGFLPNYRGSGNPWAILKNDFHHTGYAIHWVDAGVDSGKLIHTETIPITANETSFDAYQNKCYDIATDQLVHWLKSSNNFSSTATSNKTYPIYPQLNLWTYYKVCKNYKKFISNLRGNGE